MKIIMEYYESDGCTYSCTNTLPIIAESPEAAYIEFDDLVKQSKISGRGFDFHGFTLNAWQFYSDSQYYPPQFMTVDEWFGGA